METTTQLYWLTRLDGISIAFVVICIASFIGLLFSFIFYTSEVTSSYGVDEKLVTNLKKWLNKCSIIFTISLMFALFIPSKNDVIFIIAGGKTIDFIKSDTSINKIPAQTTKLITDYLQEQINKNENK
jgi:hypothetical protein